MLIFGRNRERGFGMLEVGLALVVVAFAAAGLSKMLTSNVAATKAKSNAERLTMVTLAADQYLIQNEQQLKSVLPAGGAPIAIPVGKTCASCAIPSGPSGLPSVQGDGLLSSAYIDLNNNQQSHALIVKELGSGDLDAIVTTYGGSAIDDENLGYITGLIGAAAGGVYSNGAIAPTNQISGAHGGWGDATSSWNASIGGTNVRPSSGHVQVSLSLAQASGMGAINPDDVLFRTSNGNATRNTMATDLLLGTNDIWGGSTIEGRSFRDRDNGWVVNPSGQSQMDDVNMRGDVNVGTGGNPPIRFRPSSTPSNQRIMVGTSSGNTVMARGDGRLYVDREATVGTSSGSQVVMNNSGEIDADGNITSGGNIYAGNQVHAMDFRDSSPGMTDYNVNPSWNSQLRTVRIGNFTTPGNDVLINNGDNAGIHADGNITSEQTVSGYTLYATDNVEAEDVIARDNIKTASGIVRAGGDGPSDQRTTLHPDGIIQATRAVRAPNFVSGMTVEAITAPANGIVYAAGFYDVNGRDLAGVQSYPYRINPSYTDSRLRKLTVGEVGMPTSELKKNGDIVTPGDVTAAAYYYTSDERLKEDIRDLDGWEILADLDPKAYRYKDSGREAMGLIAQDVEKVLPDLVKTNDDGMKSVNYLDLIAPMIDKIQVMHERNAEQDKRLKELEELLED